VALVSILAFDLLFLANLSYRPTEHLRHLWGFVLLLVIGFIIGGRTQRLKLESALAHSREKSTRILYEFCLEIAAVSGPGPVAQVIAKRSADAISRKAVVLLPDEGERLQILAEHDPYPGADGQAAEPAIPADSAEAEVAEWAYRHGQPAGNSTETSPEAKYLYLPLQLQSKVLGVLGILIGERRLTPEERRLIDAGAGLAAMAVERALPRRRSACRDRRHRQRFHIPPRWRRFPRHHPRQKQGRRYGSRYLKPCAIFFSLASPPSKGYFCQVISILSG
jgi:two-component system sensor histidine kinase KdpD